MVKIKTACLKRISKVEQLQAVLKQKEAQLAKLQRIQQALREREQVDSS
jgi:flagellar biosynthesis/type III secretory pathway chaperone